MTSANEWENRTFKANIGSVAVRNLLGKGKSGYSYLAEWEERQVVLKIMHNEPCPYYSFGNANKVRLELDAYDSLRSLSLPIPALITCSTEKQYLIKEYIDGKTAAALIAEDQVRDSHIEQLFHMFHRVKRERMNIDYFPSNFILREDRLFYIDYEVNPYDPEWDLLNWGLYYWANTTGFKKFLETGDTRQINQDYDTGIPLKYPFEDKVSHWMQKYV